MKWAKPIARVIGNFGISFLTPLASINIGKAMFEGVDGFTLVQIVLISVLTASITTGLSVCREAVEFGVNGQK